MSPPIAILLAENLIFLNTMLCLLPPELIFAISQRVVMSSDGFNVDKMPPTFWKKGSYIGTQLVLAPSLVTSFLSRQ